MYCTPGRKAALASAQGVGIDFSDTNFASPQRCEMCAK
jgi:hypothetical protein